jgi:hypothetical protein
MLALPAAVALAAAAVTAAPARADIADRLDEPAPEIECAKWAAGAPTQITKLKGRVVVLHFSDPERITSQAALATLRKLAAAWKDAPVSNVEVVTAPMEASATTYAAKESPSWPVGWDAKGASSAKYPGTSVPRTYLIGPDGKIVWHAHVQALTKDLVQSQVDRVQFFAPGPDVKSARAVARAAADMRYAAALAEAAKVDTDKKATDADRALVKALRDEFARTWAMKKKLLDALMKDLDWGIAWRRAKQMEAIFKGTEFEDDAAAEIAKLEANPIVAYVRPAQDQYDQLVEDAAKARLRKEVESVLLRAEKFAEAFVNTKPGDRSIDLIEALKKRLAEMPAK